MAHWRNAGTLSSSIHLTRHNHVVRPTSNCLSRWANKGSNTLARKSVTTYSDVAYTSIKTARPEGNPLPTIGPLQLFYGFRSMIQQRYQYYWPGSFQIKLVTPIFTLWWRNATIPRGGFSLPVYFLSQGISRGYKDGLQPETLADGNWLVK